MKKILIILLLITSSIGFISISDRTNSNSKLATTFPIENSVYICNSSGAYAYHSSTNCSGLNRCTHTIIKVSVKDAVEKYRRRACKLCY
jgi:hypothetical protein